MIEMIPLGAAIGLVLAIIAQVFYIHHRYKQLEKKLEENVLKGAAEMIERLDSVESKIQGGVKMDKDVKKLAAYFKKKLQETKEEIVSEVTAKFEELLESPEEPEEAEEESTEVEEFEDETEEKAKDEEDSDDFSEFDDLDDYDGDRKVKDEPKAEKKEEKDEKGKKKKKA